MKKTPSYRSLEDSLAFFAEKTKKGSIDMERILKIFSGKGRDFIILLMSLPFCLPIQIPGLSVPFGLVIAFIGFRMIFGKHIWLPQKILKKEISSNALKKIAKIGVWFVKKMKKFVRPRMEQFCYGSVSKIVNGVLVVILGLLLAMPLPVPFTNLAAAWSLLFLSFGLLEDDGLFVVLGYGMTILTFVFLFILIVFFAHML